MNKWVVDALENALRTWCEKYAEIEALLTQSPRDFRGGALWAVAENICGGIKAIGYALLVLFFLYGIIKTYSSFGDIRRPETAVKLFLRFCIAKGLVSYGSEIMEALIKISQGIVMKVTDASGFSGNAIYTLPDLVKRACDSCTFFESIPLWCISLLGICIIFVLSAVLILTVYGRFFKIYMFMAISPVPLSAFAGDGTGNMGRAFLKSFAGVCIEGAVIIIACVIYSAFMTSAPAFRADTDPVNIVLKYLAETIFNMLVLVGTVKIADRFVKEIMG